LLQIVIAALAGDNLWSAAEKLKQSLLPGLRPLLVKLIPIITSLSG
jgi:hypothetical protein